MMVDPLTPLEKTLIVGLGKTGLSCAHYLSRLGVPLEVSDGREHPPGLEALLQDCPDLAIFPGGFRPEVFEAASQLVVSPGVPLSEPLIQSAKARGIEIIGDIARRQKDDRAKAIESRRLHY